MVLGHLHHVLLGLLEFLLEQEAEAEALFLVQLHLHLHFELGGHADGLFEGVEFVLEGFAFGPGFS